MRLSKTRTRNLVTKLFENNDQILSLTIEKALFLRSLSEIIVPLW